MPQRPHRRLLHRLAQCGVRVDRASHSFETGIRDSTAVVYLALSVLRRKTNSGTPGF